MKVSLWHQKPGLKPVDTLAGRIAAAIQVKPIFRMWVASAYVTVSGVRAILDCLPTRTLDGSQWLVGLDDAVTQPGAIDLILKMPKAVLRVASHGGSGARFHPKVMMFGGKGNEPSMAIVGSANLTGHALRRNSEAVAVLALTSDADRAAATGLWQTLWAQGHALAAGELDAYRVRYEAARKARGDAEKAAAKPQKPAEPPQAILAGDDAELDPWLAGTCWIDCGAVTAQGRELEIKAEQGAFFGVTPSGSKPVILQFNVSSGETVPLRLKFQKNSMWRVQLTKEVPEVVTGLRKRLPDGSLARSELAAVFRRLPDGKFSLRFVKIGSASYKKLNKESQSTGTVGQTRAGASGRLYGWC